MLDTRLVVVCHDRMLEDCSYRLTHRFLEVNFWKSRKKVWVLDAKEAHLVVQVDQNLESEHSDGVVVLGLQPRLGSKGTTSVSISLGANGNVTNTDFEKLGLLALCMPVW
jgi:hypothetical protein